MLLTKHNLLPIVQSAPLLDMKLAGANGLFEGYASVFGGTPDDYGDLIAPGAFKASLDAHKAAGTSPALLWGHDQSRPIGKWIELLEDAKGLKVKGQLTIAAEAGREAYEHLKAKSATGLSIGYRAIGRTVNADGTATLTEIDLKEISVVTIPAKTEARVTAVKSLFSYADFERGLREGTLPPLPRKAAKKLAAGGWPALVGTNEAKSQDEEELQKAIGSLAATLKRSIITYRKG